MGVRGSRGRSRGDPGKIHRSKGFGVQECQRIIGRGMWMREEGGPREGGPRGTMRGQRSVEEKKM